METANWYVGECACRCHKRFVADLEGDVAFEEGLKAFFFSTVDVRWWSAPPGGTIASHMAYLPFVILHSAEASWVPAADSANQAAAGWLMPDVFRHDQSRRAAFENRVNAS